MNTETKINKIPSVILLVDDQKLTARMLNRIIAGEIDLVLHAIQYPLQAISLADTINPDVILLDLVMSPIDGLNLLKQFRLLEKYQEVPIIMLSTIEESETKAQAFESGANDYLIKLPDRIEMLARLRYHAKSYSNLLKSQHTQQTLLESERRFRFVTESISEAIIAVNMKGEVTFWNQGAERCFGYNNQEIFGKSVLSLIPERFQHEHTKGFKHLQKTGKSRLTKTTFERWGLKKDGSEFPMELSINTWIEGGENTFVSVIRDITERKLADDKIRYQANHDTLTDLPNRAFFMQCLKENLSLAHRQQRHVALIFIDLDKFKWVNDTLGHAAGDQLLQEASQRLKQCIRMTDTLARLGGDEFTAILYDIVSRENTVLIAEKMLKALNKPFKLEGNITNISGSIGITLFPEDASTMEPLLRNADMAMYVAKKSGRNRFWFFKQQEEPTSESTQSFP